MQTWSYRCEEIKVSLEEEAAERLNELGAQGWECFNVVMEPGGMLKHTMRCWLKRPGRPLDPAQAELD